MNQTQTEAVNQPSEPANTGVLNRIAFVGGLVLVVGAGGWYFMAPVAVESLRREAEEKLAAGGDVAPFASSLRGRGLVGEAKLLQARAALRQGDTQLALQLAESIAFSDPAHTSATCLIGESLLLMGQPLFAGERFQEVLKTEPDNERALLGLAAVWYDLGALVRALEPAEKAATLNPKDGKALHLLGSVHLQLGERAIGREKLEQAVERALSPRQAREVIGQLLELDLADGRVAEAEGLAKRLEAFQPGTTREKGLQAWLMEARTENEAEKSQALDLLVVLGRENPQDATLARWQGEMAMRLGRAIDAVGPLELTARLEPQSQEARHLLARALDRSGQTEKAKGVRADLAVLEGRLKLLTELNSKVDANPLDAAPRLEMAKVCEALGKPDWAQQWRESVRGLGGPGGNQPK